MSDVHAAIQLKTRTFVEDLTTLIKQAALESVESALQLDRRWSRPPSEIVSERSGKRIRRSASSLADVADRLYEEIKARPGQRIEHIARNLGVSTKSLARPAKMLLASNRITTQGHKRATQYYATN
jgi:hypothetical protein